MVVHRLRLERNYSMVSTEWATPFRLSAPTFHLPKGLSSLRVAERPDRRWTTFLLTGAVKALERPATGKEEPCAGYRLCR